MKNKLKWLGLFLVICLMVGMMSPVMAETYPSYDLEGIRQASEKALTHTASVTTNPGYENGEWEIINLNRGGKQNKSLNVLYKENLINKLKETNGVLSKSMYTAYSKSILALTSCGFDPTDVGGYNLLQKLAEYEKVCFQGNNGPIWALVALDSKDYEIPEPSAGYEKTITTRKLLVQFILDKQLKDGGWDLRDVEGDPDMTAMALYSLAPYYKNQEKFEALDLDMPHKTFCQKIEQGLTCIQNIQTESGGFASWGSETSESSAQVIMCLTELGIDPCSAAYTKNEFTPLDALMRYYNSETGGFAHLYKGEDNGIASEQGTRALVAYLRFKDGETSFFDMSDVEEVKPEIKPYDLGDPSGDGEINATDALLDLQHVVEISTLEGEAFTAGDVDKSGTINASDALGILQYVVGINTKF